MHLNVPLATDSWITVLKKYFLWNNLNASNISKDGQTTRVLSTLKQENKKIQVHGLKVGMAKFFNISDHKWKDGVGQDTGAFYCLYLIINILKLKAKRFMVN